ncbi:MAG: resolvase [Burkholderiales bacterium RIFOXYC12_FULL_65_23]|jgi:putative DNA-invertase from lambdoid prophage Rac|uniref:recombinase family protein n=1 Tax=Malikia spinosa TaxID=86180 RepID=UPI0008ABD925|nr:MAG: resolvase [Burkholderiales bacterium RIFOXYC12_FULL_65_23]
MRVFAYGRVSTADQTSSNQLQELQSLGHEIQPQRWFSDTVSGKVPSSERPEFMKMLDRMEAGDMLLVSKLDRIGRDMVDVISTLRSLAARNIKVKVLALGDVDLTSTAGKAVVGILAVVAEMERDLLVERTQAGLARAKAEGTQLGRPSKTSEEDRQQIRERLFKGDTVSQVARDFGVSRGTVINVREKAMSA